MRIVTLTPNPAWDVTHQVAQLTPASSHRVTEMTARAGGKGVNVARTLLCLFGPDAPLANLPAGMREDFEHSQSHCEIHAVMPVGGQIGELLRHDLAAVAGLTTHLVPVAGATRQSIAVVPRDGSHPTLFNEPGAALSLGEWDELVRTTLGLLAPGSVLTISGSMPPGPGPKALSSLVQDAQARGAQVLVDVSGAPLIAARESGADLLKPNREEFLEADPTGAAASFAPRSIVIVTDGPNGMQLFPPQGYTGQPTGDATPAERVPALPLAPAALAGARFSGPPVHGNPTGAGDAALAALAWFFAGFHEGRGLTLREAIMHEEPAQRVELADLRAMLALAVAVSAAAVREPSAGSVQLASIEEFFSQNQLITA